MYEHMLCQTGTDRNLKNEGWVAEVKFDGTRAFLIKKDETVKIVNRRGIDYSKRLPEIALEAQKVQGNFILDGEICYFNKEGLSVFTPCQSLLDHDFRVENLDPRGLLVHQTSAIANCTTILEDG